MKLLERGIYAASISRSSKRSQMLKRCLAVLTGSGLKAALLLAVFMPRPVLACAACYGQSDSPMARGMNWGILSLLAVIVPVLLAIASFFIYIIKRAASMSNLPPQPASSHTL